MLLSPRCPLLFQPPLAAAQKYSQTLELGKLGLYLQGFAMERKREEEETRGCFSRNPVLRMQDFFPADLQADSLKPEFQNRKKTMAFARKMTGKQRKSSVAFKWISELGLQLSFSAAQLTVSLLCTGMSEKSGDTHAHMQTQTRIHQLQK